MQTHSSLSHAFVTLTYDDEHLPEDGNGVESDVVNFIKRLRDRLDYPEGLKYFYTSEYGSKNGRVHYHLILLNLPRDVVDFVDSSSRKKFRSLITDTWSQGRTESSQLLDRRIRYVVDYVSKDDKLLSEKFGHTKEFRCMSKFIGFDWIDNPDNQKFVETNNCVRINGFKYSVPSYYKRKLRERKSIVEQEISKIDSRIEFLYYLHNQHYFSFDVDLFDYKQLLIERNSLDWFCRDKEFETQIKKAKRRRQYYFRKIYSPIDYAGGSLGQILSMKAFELLADPKDLSRLDEVSSSLFDLEHAYEKHKFKYRRIWLSEHGDPHDRFEALDRKIYVIESHIEDAVIAYVKDVRASAPQRLKNFKAKRLLKLSKSMQNSEIRHYWSYINYED